MKSPVIFLLAAAIWIIGAGQARAQQTQTDEVKETRDAAVDERDQSGVAVDERDVPVDRSETSSPPSAEASSPSNADDSGLATGKPGAPAEPEMPGSEERQQIAIGGDEPTENGNSAAGDEAAPLADRETPEEELQRYFQLYKDAMENEAYVEADALAKRVVELSIGMFGINSIDSARALTNLGIAQHQNEQYEAAIANYEAAIDVIERVEDRLNENLVNPLKGLGAAQLASGRPDIAAETFQRAVHVTHVNEGPHNLMQVDVLESLAETHLSAGNFEEAERLTEIIFGIEARDLEMDSMEILPVLEKQAYWQQRLWLFEKERYTWRKVIDIIEDHRGDDDLRLIPPLIGLGKSYLYIGQIDSSFHHPTSISSGEVYLKRAVRIAEDNSDATWRTREDTMLALGDFYIMSGQSSRARKVYEDVWELLSSVPDEERLQHRRDHLETPVVLQDIKPPKYVGIDGEVRTALPGEDYETGKLVYDYTVSTRGYTTDVVLAEAQPAAFEEMQRTVQRDLRSLIYRPRLVNGEAVDATDLTYTHKFFYRQSDLTELKQETDVASESE